MRMMIGDMCATVLWVHGFGIYNKINMSYFDNEANINCKYILFIIKIIL
jgi:hypothetical protein